jgi:pimeloyl-ACP methyl ester carboxylesterase
MPELEAARTPLDPREETFRIESGRDGLLLFLRRMPSVGAVRGSVLYLHGATFPSALSVAHRFAGHSWRDAVCEAGFDVWALDFLGFGGSDRHPEMDKPADAHAPLGAAAEAVQQVETAAGFILARDQRPRLSLITHSWGSMPDGLYAAHHRTLVDRIVMFAPITRREGPRYAPRPTLPAWKLVTNEEQWARFVEDVPAAEAPVLSRDDFNEWAKAYLNSDPAARDRDPPAIKTPTGPVVEIQRASHGELAWDPSAVEAPVGTHLMHLEAMRTAL